MRLLASTATLTKVEKEHPLDKQKYRRYTFEIDFETSGSFKDITDEQVTLVVLNHNSDIEMQPDEKDS